MRKFCFFTLFFVCPAILLAKVPILVTKHSAALIDDKNISALFEFNYVENEDAIRDDFLEKRVGFAIIRKDILQKLFLGAKRRPYYIIGKIRERVNLQLVAKDNRYTHIEDLYHKQIGIDRLRYNTNKYIKSVLKNNAILYNVNLHSMDFYPGIHALKRDKVDALFMLTTPLESKRFKGYLQPYPKGFLSSLEQFPELSCGKRLCGFQYYLIASKHVGKTVMHNVYIRLHPIWGKNRDILSTLGDYYIDTTYEAPHMDSTFYRKITTKKSSPKISFGRAPWMDIAVEEAVRGKGVAENVLPMLDLSYKYIRFSKGDKGITTAPNDNKEGSWCAAYICWTLNESGFKVHNKWRMASQSFRYFKGTLYKKIDKPIFGAITLYTNTRNPRRGHVGYLFGRTPSGKNIILGGNQNNRLKFASYPSWGFGSYRFNGFYVPVDYVITEKDYLSKKDIYPSADVLNKRYGIKKSRQSGKVR